MRKILNYISGFSLWLAVLTLSTHLLLPHDHHLTDSFSDQDENCPVSNNKSEHRSGYPMHCHSFNDLALEKARPQYISQKNQCNYADFTNSPKTFDFDFQLPFGSLYSLQNTIFDSFTFELLLLRAPPSLV
jgi:hypothetical protein